MDPLEKPTPFTTEANLKVTVQAQSSEMTPDKSADLDS